MQDLFPLTWYKREAKKELENILHYWITRTVDLVHGGFMGRIDGYDLPHSDAPKGAVLNARILWSFSAAFNYTSHAPYLDYATRAYDYITRHFIDRQHGGVYWSVTATGEPLEDKKQLYACAFVLYALAEFYKATKNEIVLREAVDLYAAMNAFGHDAQNNGYREAFSRDWKPLADQRLSSKDENVSKSMNTNLHVLEAFANLYMVWPQEELRKKIVELLNIFSAHIIDPFSGHLRLFFDDEWNYVPAVISYGHDIEAAWLLEDAARIIHDEELIKRFSNSAVTLAVAASEGLDKDGGLWYEYELSGKKLIKQKHWWPQAEAMVGFFNAWQVFGETQFLQRSVDTWKFIKEHIIDNTNGEWFWGIEEDGSVMRNEDKAGIWKCNYHNSRACLEIMRRIG